MKQIHIYFIVYTAVTHIHLKTILTIQNPVFAVVSTVPAFLDIVNILLEIFYIFFIVLYRNANYNKSQKNTR